MEKYFKPEYVKNIFIKDYLNNNYNHQYNLSSFMIEILYNHNDGWVRISVSDCQNIKPEIISYLLDDKYISVIINLAKNKNISLPELIKLSHHETHYVRAAVAQNPKTPISILEELSKGDDWYDTIGKVLINLPNVTVTMLDNLSNHKSFLVRKAVALHKKTSPDILEELSKDNAMKVRLAVLENKNTSIDTIENLKKDKNRNVSHHAVNEHRKRILNGAG